MSEELAKYITTLICLDFYHHAEDAKEERSLLDERDCREIEDCLRESKFILVEELLKRKVQYMFDIKKDNKINETEE